MPQDSFATTPLVLQTVQDAVVERLRALILSRQLQPGQRLVQADLAEQLGVSRTPIRDALTRLAHEGLVNLTSYKSATVACFSAADLEEIFAVRIGLESYAAFMAARHVADAEQCSGFERLEPGADQSGADRRDKRPGRSAEGGRSGECRADSSRSGHHVRERP